MLNYGNLSDFEFESLCKDILSRNLGVSLRVFSRGKDGGIDITDDPTSNNIVAQAKHYIGSTQNDLISALKREIPKVAKFSPKQYYVFTSRTVSAANIEKIYNMFSDYMKSSENIITANEIESFLASKENSDILKAHYKLWIDSTGILDDIYSNALFVDCEALLGDVVRQKDYFVRTEAYNKAMECLEKNHTLLITGNPGVGKTITSNMIVLYYSSLGNRVRYTTDTSDIKELKRAISLNKDEKEIVLLDDCFGQAYFSMKETQGKELISLIRFINSTKNKYLILNSRVTIYQEVQERTPEFVKCFKNNEFKLFILNIDGISDIEKAKIFYNHLYFEKVPKPYIDNIVEKKNYLKIIQHKNYNPRLIEYICSAERYGTVPSEKYCEYILYQLKHPKDIWNDEYERKLQKTDRILLSTLYSLTNTQIPESTLKYCFEKRLVNEQDIDKTINHYEASLTRLNKGFISIVDKNGSKMISVSNPSVNDYMDSRFEKYSAEKDAVLINCIHIRQMASLKNIIEFSRWAKDIVISHQCDNFIYDNEAQKTAFIAHYLSKYQIFDNYYQKTVQLFFSSPEDFCIFTTYPDQYFNEIVVDMLVPDFMAFYGLYDIIYNNDLEVYWDRLYLEDLVKMICALYECCFEDNAEFVSEAEERLREEIDTFYENVSVGDYDLDYAEAAKLVYEELDEICLDDAVDYLESKAFESAQNNIDEILSELPSCFSVSSSPNITSYLRLEYEDSLKDYLDDPTYSNRLYSIAKKDSMIEEIDAIFNR